MNTLDKKHTQDVIEAIAKSIQATPRTLNPKSRSPKALNLGSPVSLNNKSTHFLWYSL